MSTLSLIYKEIRHRWVNFFLGLLAIVTAVALFVLFFTAGKASNRETARLMLSMGFNLHIISKDTDINEFLLTGVPDRTIPEQYLKKLSAQRGISYNHLLATLQKKISWQGLEVILTGLAPEVCPPGRQSSPMSYQIEPGNLYAGYRVAEVLGLTAGDIVEIEGKMFKVAKCLAESGDADDIRIQCHLADAQDILQLPGRISEIQAVDCLCFVPTDDPVSILRSEIASLLPEAQVFQIRAIATARAKQRQMVKNLFAIVLPLVVIACGAWIAVLAILNVRDRQAEVGVMRALGYGSGKITSLFFGKAVVTGVLGAIVGFLVGSALAMSFGPDIFKITAKTMIKPELPLLFLSLVFAPVFAAVSSFIPAAIAVTQDPADTLSKE
jgi:ABC-type lipoprotein release transport system permease subunit